MDTPTRHPALTVLVAASTSGTGTPVYRLALDRTYWPDAMTLLATLIDTPPIARETCTGCGEPWPCSDRDRTDISGRERAKHHR